MLHSPLDQAIFIIHCATTIVAFLDEGSHLMANTFCCISFMKIYLQELQYVTGTLVLICYATIQYICTIYTVYKVT